jgi:hypothetical protein
LAIAASFLLALVVVRGWSGGSHSPDSFLHPAVNEYPLKPSAAANDWETVTLAGAGSPDGQAETFSVPAQRRDTLDENMLKNIPAAIPPELQQAFEQSGYRVEQQREIVPVPMNDDRRLVVPVDHVKIHYVGRPSL